MSETPYEVARLDEIERADDRREWIPIRRHFGIAAFGVNAWSADDEGAELIPAHDERTIGHEELYVVVRGAARFTIDGARHEVPAGSVVLVAPQSVREAHATAPDTAVLVIGGKPGSHTVSDWEARQLALGRRA